MWLTVSTVGIQYYIYHERRLLEGLNFNSRMFFNFNLEEVKIFLSVSWTLKPFISNLFECNTLRSFSKM